MKKNIIILITSSVQLANAVTSRIRNSRTVKRNEGLLQTTNIKEMAAAFNIDPEALSKAILSATDEKTIGSLWQQKLPLHERCKLIYNTIFPLKEEWSTLQVAGLVTLSRGLYLSPEAIIGIARKKSQARYLEKFLGFPMEGTATEEKYKAFAEILFAERKLFHDKR